MSVSALSYIGVNSDKLEDWSDYSEKCLGMQKIDRGKGSLSFRMDDHKQRLAITGDTGDSLAFVGFEVDKKEDLQTYAAKLESKNIKVIWPNNNETFVSEGDDWFSSAEKAGLEIPTGCLTGSCGACEIDVNGETVRACISNIKSKKNSQLNISLTTDPFWEG